MRIKKIKLHIALISIGLISIPIIIGLISKTDSQSKNPFPDASLKITKVAERVSDTPVFTLYLNKENKTSLSMPKAYADNVKISAEVYHENEAEKNLIPQIHQIDNKTYNISISNTNGMKAGKNSLKVTASNGKEAQTFEQDFTWGVLAINPNKSVYLPQEDVDIAMAVLDDQGKMDCKAEVSLLITKPNGEKFTLSTKTKSIKVTNQCNKYTYSLKPDFETSFKATQQGVYKMRLTAKTIFGTHEINDSIKVVENASFDIERIGPTRLYPPLDYPMTIKIKANKDFNGEVIERVPSSFEIKKSKEENTQDYASIRTESENKTMTWKLNLKKGEEIKIGYIFNAPDKSPAFFLIDPLTIKERDGEFKEERYWQLAIDATYTISGTFYDIDESTAVGSLVCDGSTATIGFRVNGGTETTATCANPASTYSTNITAVAGNVLTIYSKNGFYKANVVIVLGSSTTITGVDLYKDNVIVRDENGSGVTNSNMDNWDSGNDSTNMLFSVTSSNLTLSSGKELHVWTGDTYSPGGTVTTSQGASGITATSLTNGHNAFGSTSDTTASITPSPNKLILLAISSGDGSAAPTSVTGNNLTWVQVGSTVSYTDGVVWAVSLWRAMGASPSGGAITINWPASLGHKTWNVIQVSGVDTSGTNGSGAIVQSAGNSATGTVSSLTVTLSSFADSTNNAAFGFFHVATNTGVTPGSGFTEIDEHNGTSFWSTTNETEYKLGQDTSVDASFSSTTSAGGIAVELKAATGQGGNLHLDDSSTTTLANATNAIGNDILVDTSATLNINASTTVSGGDITTSGTGVVANTSGTPTVTISGTGNIGGGSGAITFYNLSTSGTGTTTTTSDLTVTNVLTIGGSTTLIGKSTITLSGAGTPFVITGTFTPSTSTINYTGTTATNIAAATYNNLGAGPTANASTVTYTLAGDTTVSNVLTVGAASGAGIHTLDASSRTLTLSGSPTAWYNASWSYRVPVTIDHTKVGADQTDFPVYVNLANLPSDFHANVNQTDARDIRVTKNDGITELPREVASYGSSTDTGELYFKYTGTLSSSTDTTVYIYYGNAGASEPAANATYGKNNVWTNSYAGVWHFTEGTGTSTTDSTSSSNNGTLSNSPAWGSGKIGNAVVFSGGTQSVDTNYTQTSAQAYTISTWVKTTESATQRTFVQDRGTGAGKSLTLGIGTTGGGHGGAGKIGWELDSDSTDIGVSSASTVNDNTWHYVTGTWAATSGTAIATSQFTVYIDGSSASTTTGSVGSATSPLSGLSGTKFGRHDTWATSLTGTLDEIRISTASRSATWISTDYNNQSSPSTFYSEGAQETGPITSPLNINSSGAFTASTSTVNYTGTTATNIAAATYNNLGAGPTANASTVTYTLAGDTTVGSVLTVGASSGAGIHTLDASSRTLTLSGSPTAWYNASWSYRVPVTIDHTKVGADQTDFPVYVDLSNLPSGFHTNVNQTDARDIRVTKNDGVTELPREVVTYNSGTDTGELYFKYTGTLSSSTDTTVYIYYGNAGASDYAVSATYGRNNVWTNGYKSVYHMNDATTSSISDSVGANDGTKKSAGTPAVTTSGKVGSAQNFTSGDYITLANEANFDFEYNSTYSVEAWVNPTSVAGVSQALISKLGNTAPYRGWELNLYDTTGGTDSLQGFLLNTYGTSGISARTASNTISAGSWQHVAMTYSGNHDVGGVNFYLGGASSSKTTIENDLGTNTMLDNLAVTLGARADTYPYPYVGLMDEVRISSVERTSTWISTEYNNQSSPSTFYSEGTQEAGSLTSPLNVNSSGVFTPSTSTVSYTGNNSNGNTTVATTNTTYKNLTINNGSETFVTPATTTLTVGGNLTVTAGTFDANTNNTPIALTGNLSISGTFLAPPSATFTVAGNFTNNGTFTHDSGTVTLNGGNTQTLAGSGSPAVTFYNLTLSGGNTVQFTAGETFRTNGLFTVSGSTNINSTTASQWFINHQGTETVNAGTITNSGCDGTSTTITIAYGSGTDGGNNGTCWSFGSPPPLPSQSRVKGNIRVSGGVRIKTN